MKLGIDIFFVAIYLATSLKLWKGESKTTPFTKDSLPNEIEDLLLTIEFLSDVPVEKIFLLYLLGDYW
jgi:hypothetical protein